MKRSKLSRAAAAVVTLALCAALCLSAASLYRNGMEQRQAGGSAAAPVFTREAVGRQLSHLCPLFGLWLAVMVAAALTGAHSDPLRAAQPPEITLSLLRARAGDLPEAARREEARRKRTLLAYGAAAALCAVWAGVWLLNREHFASWDLEQVMGSMLTHILPPLILGFAVLCDGARRADQSRLREIDLLREALRGRPAGLVPVPMKTAAETGARRAMRAALYAAALALIVLGVLNGGLNDVLIKAINICTECIGLG